MKYIKNKNIKGCTDNGHQKWSKYPGYPACNYNPKSKENDGTCEYESCFGCTDPQCDEAYDINYKIPAQKFQGYGVCEPCSYLNLPRNFYPPVKGNDYASPIRKFTYMRGDVLYTKPFGEVSFGYVSKDEIKKVINNLKNLLTKFTGYNLWLYGEIIDNIPARDIKIIITSKSDFKISELQNLMMMCIASSKRYNICLDIRFHYKNTNGDFYSKSFPVGHHFKISTIVPYNIIKYNGKIIEANDGNKIDNYNLWSVVKYFPDKNKTNYYKKKQYIDHGVINLNDKHLKKHIDNYQIEVIEDSISPHSIDFIKNKKPLT